MLGGEEGFVGEADIGLEAEAFLARREEADKQQEKEHTKEKAPKSSKVAEILEDLRGRDNKTAVTVLDGIDIISAEIEDNAAETELALGEERIPTEELNKILETLEHIQFMEGFSYEDLSQAINYLRAKRDFMNDMFRNSLGTFTEAGQNSNIYQTILTSIYDAMPFAFTAEAILPEVPNYLPTPPEKYLDKLPAGKDRLTYKDTQQFYKSLNEDVSSAFMHAAIENPQWVEQKKVMLALDAYLQEHRSELTGEPLVVTVKTDDEPVIEPYQAIGSSLKEDLEAKAAETGGRTFIFDPSSKEDMKYMTDIFAFNKWAIYADQAVQGIDLLAEIPTEEVNNDTGNVAAFLDKKPDKKKKKDGKKEGKKEGKDKDKDKDKDKVEITTPQFDGMRFLHSLFIKAYEGDHIDDKYKDQIRGVTTLLYQVPSDAKIKRVAPPDVLSVELDAAA